MRFPVYIAEAKTNRSYVLLRADVYERFKAAFEEEFDPRESYPFMDRVMSEDNASNPTLAEYQRHPVRITQ